MASLAVSDTPDGHRLIALAGRLDASTVPSVWGPAHRALDDAATQPVTVDTAAVESCDGAGIALLVDLASHPRAAPVEVVHMRPDVATLFRQFDLTRLEHDLDPPPKQLGVVPEIGRATFGVGRDLRNMVSFVGSLTAALGFAITHPAQRALEATCCASASAPAPTRCRSWR